MKLSKAELKLQKEVYELIKSDKKLTDDDLEYVYKNFNPGYISDVTTHSAYFTPLDMAYDFALFAGRSGVCVDMCAGIGILSYAATIRDNYEKNITHQICIERNPDYIEIGKRLLPDVDWIQGDMFDKSMWDNILKKYGRIDSIVSNPPFGKVTKTDTDRSWLKYQGADLDIASIEVALEFTSNVTMILPVGSCTFKYSGRPYHEHVDNRKIDKLKKDTGLEFYMACDGVDTSVYSEFKNTKIAVEIVSFSVEEGE